jgi:hypothetical protein
VNSTSQSGSGAVMMTSQTSLAAAAILLLLQLANQFPGLVFGPCHAAPASNDDKLPAHVAKLVRAAWELGGRPEFDGLRLRAWAHMLGFGGHWSTKSRCYSTTMGALRRARVAFAKRRRARDGIPLDAWERPEDDQAVIVVASWVYVGSGYATEGERWLALSAAARAREQREVAREEVRTMTAA